MPGRWIRIGIVAILIASGCAEPGGSPRIEKVVAPSPRLVLFYVPCTVNRNALAPYGEDVGYTPNLSKFASQSIVFDRHTTEEAQSGIAYASIFSGAQADQHGAFLNPPPELPPDSYLLGEVFRDGGYAVTYLNGHRMASAEYGFARGVSEAHTFVDGSDVSQLLEPVLQRLSADPEYKACVFVNFTVTHSPYAIDHVAEFLDRHPESSGGFSETEIREFHELYLRRRVDLEWDLPAERGRMEAQGIDFDRLLHAIDIIYRSNVAYLDTLFGDVIKRISDQRLDDEALIVFTADHGETLSRPNAVFHWTHGFQLSPEDIVVPLIMRAPGLAPGHYEQVTRSVDLLPTVAALAGIALPNSAGTKIEGRDLSAAIRQQAPRPALTAYFHSSCNPWDAKSLARRPVVATLFPDGGIEHVWTGLMEGDTYVRHRMVPGGSWIYEVYDLASDPGLERNLYSSGDPRHVAWVEALGRYRDRLNAKFSHRSMGDEELEALRSLGYVD